MSLIVNGNLPDDNIVIWHFYYKKCSRSWRKKGLKIKVIPNEINNIILREYLNLYFLRKEILITKQS